MGNRLERELDQLQRRVGTMAESVQRSLAASVAALQAGDAAAARQVSDADRAINDQRFSLEGDVVAVIATQQPVAVDVRLLVGILEIATELERMGDYAKDIARIAIRAAAQDISKPAVSMTEITEMASAMLEQAIQAFADGDADLAASVSAQDDKVDELCRTLHRQLVENACSQSAALEQAVLFLPAVHNVERFADRVTNICERIIYIATGTSVELDDARPTD